LYGPRAFRQQLALAEAAAVECKAAQTEQDRQAVLRRYHGARLTQLSKEWQADLAEVGIKIAPSREPIKPVIGDTRPPRAEVAGRIAVAKAATELTVLRKLSSSPRILDPIAEDAAWGSLAALHANDARLDESSTRLIRNKNLGLYGGSDPASRAALERSVSELVGAIALDTVRNEYILHTKIHEWFVTDATSFNLALLNDRIYAELFLTPSSDPWLGLVPRDKYTGIEDDGIRK
jgi:hypothetical protein